MQSLKFKTWTWNKRSRQLFFVYGWVVVRRGLNGNAASIKRGFRWELVYLHGRPAGSVLGADKKAAEAEFLGARCNEVSCTSSHQWTHVARIEFQNELLTRKS